MRALWRKTPSLTLTLSQGERGQTATEFLFGFLDKQITLQPHLLPLPLGDGWGEGGRNLSARPEQIAE
jgi:hypothetical protein